MLRCASLSQTSFPREKKKILRTEFRDGTTRCCHVIPGGQFSQRVHMPADVESVLPPSPREWWVRSASSPVTPRRVRPAVMESVDCWPLGLSFRSRQLGGTAGFSNHLSGCDCPLVSLTFTVNGTASNHVSGVCVFTRGGPHVRRDSDEAIGCDLSCSHHFGGGDLDVRSHARTPGLWSGPHMGNCENPPSLWPSRLALRTANG